MSADFKLRLALKHDFRVSSTVEKCKEVLSKAPEERSEGDVEMLVDFAVSAV